MKYSSGIRLINVIIFALLTAGFVFLAVWFGFLITPFLWIGKGSPIDLPDISFGLAAMLGCFGLAGALIAGKGLLTSIFSMLRENDDEPVVKSFGCYIGIGYLVAAFLLLNAMWLYRLTSSNLGDDDIGFVVTVYVIALIVVLLATNVPMVRLFGDESQFNKVMQVLSYSLCSVSAAIGIVFGVAYLVTKTSSDPFYGQATVSLEIGVPAIIGLVACLLCLVAYLGYVKADKNKTVVKRNGILFECALVLSGASILVTSVFENIYQGASRPSAVSLVAKAIGMSNVNYLDFCITGYILGGAIVLAGILFMFSTLFPKKRVVSEL